MLKKANICFFWKVGVPKLQLPALQRKRARIETVALRLFCAQGFHGTSVRQIAESSGVSIGNIYNYYRTKEQIWESLVARYQRQMLEERKRLLDRVRRPFDPADWQRLARGIRDLVRAHGDYWRLMYIDVTEFENRHFRRSFTSLLDDFRRHFEDGTWPAGAHAGFRGVDPAVVFGALWMQFFNYFLVESLFHGGNHFGVSDGDFVKIMCKLYLKDP
jgi:AcrR family transcriptional regulator